MDEQIELPSCLHTGAEEHVDEAKPRPNLSIVTASNIPEMSHAHTAASTDQVRLISSSFSSRALPLEKGKSPGIVVAASLLSSAINGVVNSVAEVSMLSAVHSGKGDSSNGSSQPMTDDGKMHAKILTQPQLSDDSNTANPQFPGQSNQQPEPSGNGKQVKSAVQSSAVVITAATLQPPTAKLAALASIQLPHSRRSEPKDRIDTNKIITVPSHDMSGTVASCRLLPRPGALSAGAAATASLNLQQPTLHVQNISMKELIPADPTAAPRASSMENIFETVHQVLVDFPSGMLHLLWVISSEHEG